MATCEENSGQETTTTAVEDNGFESESEALNALVGAVMDQIEADRQSAGKDCSKRECEDGFVCETVLNRAGWSTLEPSIYAYRRRKKIRWGYKYPGGKIVSGCRCIPK